MQMHDAKKTYSVQKMAQTFFRKFDLSKLLQDADELDTCHAKRTK